MNDYSRGMCDLCSITTNQAAIIALFRVISRYVGNLAPSSMVEFVGGRRRSGERRHFSGACSCGLLRSIETRNRSPRDVRAKPLLWSDETNTPPIAHWGMSRPLAPLSPRQRVFLFCVGSVARRCRGAVCE